MIALWPDSNSLKSWVLFAYLCDFPGGSDGKESACNAAETGLVPWAGRSHARGNGYPLQDSCLENSTDRGAWPATVHRGANSWTWLSYEDQPRYHIQKKRHYFANEGPSSQGYGFSCGHVWMWELDCEESWAPKNWCFWTVVLEKTLESPLDCREIQPVHSEGDQPWDFFGRNDDKAETPVLWPPHEKS